MRLVLTGLIVAILALSALPTIGGAEASISPATGDYTSCTTPGDSATCGLQAPSSSYGIFAFCPGGDCVPSTSAGGLSRIYAVDDDLTVSNYAATASGEITITTDPNAWNVMVAFTAATATIDAAGNFSADTFSFTSTVDASTIVVFGLMSGSGDSAICPTPASPAYLLGCQLASGNDDVAVAVEVVGADATATIGWESGAYDAFDAALGTYIQITSAAPTGVGTDCAGSLPSAWTTLCEPIDYENMTLPDYPGSYYFINESGYSRLRAQDTPVVAAENPSDLLEVYYIDHDQQLVEYAPSTRVMTPLQDDWPVNISDPNALAALYGYQDAAGQVTALFEEGQLVGTQYVWVAYFSLANDTYLLENTTIPESGPTNLDGFYYNQGTGIYNASTGWMYWVSSNGEDIDFFNVFTQHLIGTTTTAMYEDGWNAVTVIPTVNQAFEEVNDYGNSTVEYLVFALDGSTIVDRHIYSPVNDAIQGLDQNNAPFFYDVVDGVTVEWGISADNSGSGSTYHADVADFYPDIASDRIVSVAETDGPGDTDTQGAAVLDTSGYYLNGELGYSSNAEYQAPFMDPENFSAIYASNSPWLNDYITSTMIGFDTSGWATPQVEYFSTSGYESVIMPGEYGTQDGQGVMLLYWLPAQIDPFLTAPTDLAATPTDDSAALTWTQSTAPSIVNNTVQLYAGSGCSGTPTFYSTSGAKTSYDLTGLVPDTVYSVGVTASNDSYTSAISNCVNFTTGGVPATPSLTVSDVGPYSFRETWSNGTWTNVTYAAMIVEPTQYGCVNWLNIPTANAGWTWQTYNNSDPSFIPASGTVTYSFNATTDTNSTFSPDETIWVGLLISGSDAIFSCQSVTFVEVAPSLTISDVGPYSFRESYSNGTWTNVSSAILLVAPTEAACEAIDTAAGWTYAVLNTSENWIPNPGIVTYTYNGTTFLNSTFYPGETLWFGLYVGVDANTHQYVMSCQSVTFSDEGAGGVGIVSSWLLYGLAAIAVGIAIYAFTIGRGKQRPRL